MAYVLANSDGTSNAKPGDVVVTGGGLYRKEANGTSTYLGGVSGLTGGKTKSYSELQKAFNDNYGGWIGGGSGGSTKNTWNYGDAGQMIKPTPDEYTAAADVNGIYTIDGIGYTFPGAPTYSTSGDANAVKNFFGYILLGLVALVILDRAVGK